jgi:fumarate hydratase class II
MNGNFELNVMMPVLAYDLLQSIGILAAASSLLADRCVAGIEADRERVRDMVERSLMMVTALVPKIGYDAAAAIAKEAYATGRTVREVCIERRLLSKEELDEVLDPREMTEGGILGIAVGG